MSQIPHSVESKLSDQIYHRSQSDLVGNALADLAVKHELVQVFLNRYEGPFWSQRLGYEFLDLIEGNETIVSATQTCRDQYGFPGQFLVLSQLSAGQIVVLDTLGDKVYEVDFDGGNKLLLAGGLAPSWDSFRSFLVDYFSEIN